MTFKIFIINLVPWEADFRRIKVRIRWLIKHTHTLSRILYLFYLLIYKWFGGTTSCAQALLLALHAGVIPNRFRVSSRVLEIKPGLAK